VHDLKFFTSRCGFGYLEMVDLVWRPHIRFEGGNRWCLERRNGRRNGKRARRREEWCSLKGGRGSGVRGRRERFIFGFEKLEGCER
jgi:hypothetical protein